MSIARWLITRLIVVIVLGLLLVWLAYAVILPAYVSGQYRRELSLDHVTGQTGESVAGSEDAVYFAARYTCRDTVTVISGPAPDAVYWMIGIYDNRLMRIPGGHLNDSTVEIGEDGQFRAVIQPGPGNAQSTLECGHRQGGIVIMRVFLPADPDAVEAPNIEQRPLE